MGKTSVMVDDKLVNSALKITHMKSKKEVIEAGLLELIRKSNKELLRRELGTFDIDLSLEELNKMRGDRICRR